MEQQRHLLDSAMATRLEASPFALCSTRCFAGLFLRNDSQHFGGMPMVDVFYGADRRLYANLNASLALWYNGLNVISNDGSTAIQFGAYRYSVNFLYLDEPGSSQDRWCIRELNVHNTFTFALASSAAVLSPPLGVNAQLARLTRP